MRFPHGFKRHGKQTTILVLVYHFLAMSTLPNLLQFEKIEHFSDKKLVLKPFTISLNKSLGGAEYSLPSITFERSDDLPQGNIYRWKVIR